MTRWGEVTEWSVEAGQVIGREDIVRGLDRELEKPGCLRTEADFRAYYRIISDTP